MYLEANLTLKVSRSRSTVCVRAWKRACVRVCVRACVCDRAILFSLFMQRQLSKWHAHIL